MELATVSKLLINHHMMEKTLERQGRRLLKGGGDDEDIPTPSHDEQPVAVKD